MKLERLEEQLKTKDESLCEYREMKQEKKKEVDALVDITKSLQS